MQLPSNTKQKYGLKDSTKGQKIVAAIYLVTGHLSESDPLKANIRTEALLLIDPHTAGLAESVQRIQSMLTIATMAGLISEKNAGILHTELALFLGESRQTAFLAPLFETEPPKQITDRSPLLKDTMSFTKIMSDTNQGHKASFENKNKRQQEILNFINERKSVGIKDISKLFADISEKTIQRELTTLVQLGRITKRGSKRWSVYMAVTA